MNKTETKDLFDIKNVVRYSTYGFVAGCLPHYVSIPSAEFHRELSYILDNPSNDLVEVIGFRDSAKSTYASLAFPLRVALSGEYHFIVLINDTTEQVKLSIANIRHEIENNPYIKKYFGDITVGKTWSETNLLLSNGVRIIGRSRGQNIRGIRHRQYRPDCIIIDDPENLVQVRKKEIRDATERWFNSEVIPAQQSFNCKLIVIGNFLHNDGFIARLERNPLFKVIKFPLIDKETGKCNWSAKYPTQEALDRQRKKVGETAWAREYLLTIVSEEDQIIKETDIVKYPNHLLIDTDREGKKVLKIKDSGTGVDLAISEKQTADYTSMVSGYNADWDGGHILVLPNPVNKRLDLDATIKEALEINKKMPFGHKFFVEDIGYQKAAVQGFEKRGMSVFPMRPITDKRARLESVAPYVKSGFVQFPENGAEDLIQQIINFGVESHDDMVDAFVYMVLGLVNKSRSMVVERIDKI